ncbi:hypothetical protein [Leptospira sp. GIMC2001]|uniref:hypothetical protein n=1 Tax=Leptospira sp. GIMC2001 TaxID=1513297 RepID=UPI00234BA08D|nr:hypothetical protein [Leptospira sp. GIMC2001]WCL49564.1 hypothetical protein O4O04_01745 [Leptospira sp. GIMC2001]
MKSIEREVLTKIQKFSSKLLKEIEIERKLDQLDREGKTWKVLSIDGSLQGRGIKEMGLATGTDQLQLF